MSAPAGEPGASPEPGRSLRAFVDEFRLCLRAWSTERPDLQAPIAEVRGSLRDVSAEARLVKPRAAPVCCHLPAALEEADAGPAPRLAGVLRALGPYLAWVEDYLDGPVDPTYFDNYASTTLVGARGLLHAPSVVLGLVLLGPDTFYPAHAHSAGELYYLLAGSAAWQVGAAPWRSESPGRLIHHARWVPHAMHAGDRPLLAVYAWYGDLSEPSRFV